MAASRRPRIWAAPEDAVKTYAPDNGPVHISVKGAVLEATQPWSRSPV